MPTLIAPKPSGSNFAPAPEGLHVARCVAMVDLGTHEDTGKFGTKRQRKIRLSFELPDELAVFNEEKGEQPYVISREFTFSMHEKAALRLFLEAWRGKKFTNSEAATFDVGTLLKVPAMLNVMHTSLGQGGRVYANVGAASRLPKNTVCPPQITPTTIFSLAEFDQEVFDSLPEWLRTKVSDSDEYKAMVNAEEAKSSGADDKAAAFKPASADDDDIPF